MVRNSAAEPQADYALVFSFVALLKISTNPVVDLPAVGVNGELIARAHAADFVYIVQTSYSCVVSLCTLFADESDKVDC